MIKTLKIIAILFLVANYQCKAQSIVPLETLVNYRNSEVGVPENITYFKDINHTLDKYVGTWKGTYNTNNFEFIISKNTSIYDGLSIDELLIRYLITTNTGVIIEDTRASLNEKCSITGDYLNNAHYALNYSGKDTKCGQSGAVFITMVKNINYSKMKLFLVEEHILLLEEICPNGRAAQVLPVEQITLTKS